jgi:hypothetical protein
MPTLAFKIFATTHLILNANAQMAHWPLPPFAQAEPKGKSQRAIFCHRTNETLNKKCKLYLNRQVNVRQDKIIW